MREAYRPDTSSQRLIFQSDEAGAPSLATYRHLDREDAQTLVTVSGRSATATLGSAWANETLPDRRNEDSQGPSHDAGKDSQSTDWSGQNRLIMRDLVTRTRADKGPDASLEPHVSTHGMPRGKPVAIEFGDPSRHDYTAIRQGKLPRRLMKEVAQLASIGNSEG